MAPSGIPVSEVRGWLDENEISDPEERREFIFLIGEMDKAWRARVAARQQT